MNKPVMTPDVVRRIEDAALTLIAAGNPTPTNEQVRQQLGGGSLSHISPVMRAFRAHRRQEGEARPTVPPELQQMMVSQLSRIWEKASVLAETETLQAREAADADIEQADQERDTALTRVAELESELAVLREVQTERDRLLEEVRQLRTEAQPLREQVARLATTGEHLTAQLQETKAELKESRAENRTLQAELLALARDDGKTKK